MDVNTHVIPMPNLSPIRHSDRSRFAGNVSTYNAGVAEEFHRANNRWGQEVLDDADAADLAGGIFDLLVHRPLHGHARA